MPACPFFLPSKVKESRFLLPWIYLPPCLEQILIFFFFFFFFNFFFLSDSISKKVKNQLAFPRTHTPATSPKEQIPPGKGVNILGERRVHISIVYLLSFFLFSLKNSIILFHLFQYFLSFSLGSIFRQGYLSSPGLVFLDVF